MTDALTTMFQGALWLWAAAAVLGATVVPISIFVTDLRKRRKGTPR